MFNGLKLKSLQKKAQNLCSKRERGVNVNIQAETKVLKELANFYMKHKYNKKFPQADILSNEYFRAAAGLNDAEAQYKLGEIKLKEAKFWLKWHEGNYGEPIHKKYARQNFEEAFALLSEADKNGYPLAKRLHGLAYINGWGVAIDQDKGFKMVVDSIEEANEWEKATEIFKQLGLNKQEFFSNMMQMRKK